MTCCPDPCEPFVFQAMDEITISKQLIATQGTMQDRVRVITPAGEWMVAIPTGNEWMRGQVLAALRPFILIHQAVGLIICTSGQECFDTWILAKGRMQGMRVPFRWRPHFHILAATEPAQDEASLLASHFAWFCDPRAGHELTWLCLRRLDATLGSSGLWPALSISKDCIASEPMTVNA